MDQHDSGAPSRAGQARLEDVERTWRGLALPGELPRRRDVDAARLGPAVAQTFLLEEVAPGTARIRVAGQRLRDWFGADPRGLPVSALFEAQSRALVREALVATFGQPAAVRVALTIPRGSLRAPAPGMLLLLPLQNDDGGVTRALGVIGLDLAVPAGPRRLAVVAGRPLAVDPIPLRVADPRALDWPVHQGFVLRGAKPGQPGQGAAGRASRELAEPARPWLRLVVSND